MMSCDQSDIAVWGKTMHQWAHELYPICRSITGAGVRETLDFIKVHLSGLEVHSVPSGTQVFDWQVPKEWEINDAYVIGPDGTKVIDFQRSNLHVLNYSVAIDKKLTLEELQPYLYSLPEQPNAIPYVTSYYAPRWGFCLSHEDRAQLKPGMYHAVIDSRHFDGELNYGEYFLPGESEKEVLISTYICHPSMANNELSGPMVSLALAKHLAQLPKRKYSYRFVFIPETIGAISFLSERLEWLKRHVVAGYVLTCIGDERNYSYLQSKIENTLSDRAAMHVLKYTVPEYRLYDFLSRGSDERQYCAPGVDLPVGSIMRTRYGDYPEYHTSLDDLSLVTPQGLAGGLRVCMDAIKLIEANAFYKVTVLCEPQLGKRGLYPTLSSMSLDYTDVRTLTNLIAYCDGEHDLIEIADKIKVCALDLLPTVEKLVSEGLLEKVKE
ncbi:DUF4910 domain-containing protein [Pseudoalteromonas viridis]|uniref:DUF4910 domain-containing protein n=1 Tax=Pseudoalteromonas viridis TaxID=339617 RepID=A0ABX7V453_9GAMM|nr:DUF4910 domain-containing protein [Pseudoalteromonas viridis]QTL34222.1 DUF4910 domain-containing protein [Pseudoalteromonas viridis]